MTQAIQLSDTTIVLRECGERTADAAFSLLQQMCPDKALFRVSAVPFSECMKRGFEIGIRQGSKWTLCIDADVLIDPIAVNLLVQFAELQPQKVFEVQGFVFDKFFGIERPAGNHLYRTEHLSTALSLIPAEGDTLRPESTTIDRMRAVGFHDVQAPIVVGLHDFEQAYRNIVTKAFLQAHKHNWLLEYLRDRWLRNSADTDFEHALTGLEAGVSHTEPVEVNNQFLQSILAETINKLNEKPHPYEIPQHFEVGAEIAKAKARMVAPEIAYEAYVKAHYYNEKDQESADLTAETTSIRKSFRRLMSLIFARCRRLMPLSSSEHTA